MVPQMVRARWQKTSRAALSLSHRALPSGPGWPKLLGFRSFCVGHPETPSGLKSTGPKPGMFLPVLLVMHLESALISGGHGMDGGLKAASTFKNIKYKIYLNHLSESVGMDACSKMGVFWILKVMILRFLLAFSYIFTCFYSSSPIVSFFFSFYFVK